jgi:hypothetical protein
MDRIEMSSNYLIFLQIILALKDSCCGMGIALGQWALYLNVEGIQVCGNGNSNCFGSSLGLVLLDLFLLLVVVVSDALLSETGAAEVLLAPAVRVRVAFEVAPPVDCLATAALGFVWPILGLVVVGETFEWGK